MNMIMDPKLNRRLIFAYCFLAINVFQQSTTYVNELIYRGMRSWVLKTSLEIHKNNIAVAVDQACSFWQWWRTTNWLIEYRESHKETNEKSLQAWFENRCVQLLSDDELRRQLPQE